jgi:hypothetical protein
MGLPCRLQLSATDADLPNNMLAASYSLALLFHSGIPRRWSTTTTTTHYIEASRTSDHFIQRTKPRKEHFCAASEA